MVQKQKDSIKMERPVLLHVFLFGLAVVIALILPSIYSLQVSASTAADSTRTLLALNGTLLALVVGFSAFYFAVIDARRIEAARPADKDSDSSVQILKELSRASVPLYRKKMNEVSTLLIGIACSYGFFLLLSYIVYLYSLSVTGNITGVALCGFIVSAASPFVTVGDAIIMTWFLTRDIAGRSPQKQLKAVEKTLKEFESENKGEKDNSFRVYKLRCNWNGVGRCRGHCG